LQRNTADECFSTAPLSLIFEEVAWSRLYATKDQKEGIGAFVEKRKQDFIGN
jgi:1,4-dihydroxy-2-naphthoyl-CoA synthase